MCLSLVCVAYLIEVWGFWLICCFSCEGVFILILSGGCFVWSCSVWF